MPDPRRILIVRPSALGDVCRTAPVLAALGKAYPDATIDWLVNEAFVPAIEHHPALSEAVPFPRKQLGMAMRRGRLWEGVSFLRRLGARDYDLVIDCQGLARSGLFAWATRAERRVGDANARELGWLGCNERYHVDASLHAVDRMMRLTNATLRRDSSASGGEDYDMRLYAAPAELEWVADQPWSSGGYALLAPTSRWPGKRWPADRFAQVARQLLGRGIDHVVLVGAPGEREQCGALLQLTASDARVLDLVGQTSVGRLLAVIARSSLVVANDSAAVHMAVGFDRPLVALYGPTRVRLVGPYRRAEDVIQHIEPGDLMAHKDETRGIAMMKRIGVEEVVAACASRLAARSSPVP